MEKNNGKVVAIVALVVAVVALSVGFAAFSDTLTIDGNANVAAAANPFDDTTNGLAYSSTAPKCYATGDSNQTAIGTPGTASGDTWSGISVPLNSTTDSVTCVATVLNKTSYTAYLRSISASAGLSCASTGANATTNANNVCSGAQVVVNIGGTDSLTINGTTKPADATGTSSLAPTDGTATVTVTISYNKNALTDEDVTITLPTITHTYSSASTGN